MLVTNPSTAPVLPAQDLLGYCGMLHDEYTGMLAGEAGSSWYQEKKPGNLCARLREMQWFWSMLIEILPI